MDNNYDSNSLSSTLKYIKTHFGDDVFSQSSRLVNLLSDLAPNLKKENKMIERLANMGVLNTFTNTVQNTFEKEQIVSKYMILLTESEYIQPAIAASYMKMLVSLFDWNIDFDFQREEKDSADVIGSKTNGMALPYLDHDQTEQLRSLPEAPADAFECSFFEDHVEIDKYIGTMYEFTIPKIINGLKVTVIGDFAFDGCTGLTSITIPDSVTNIGDFAFCGCTRLTSITIPDSVASIGEYAFSHCSWLTSITIPKRVTSIKKNTFYDCCSLTAVTIPASVTSIGESSFDGCTGLTSITIPDSVTSIGDSAFYNCNSLTHVKLPASVTSIGKYAFLCCDNLTLYVDSGSYAEKYAKIESIPFCKNSTPTKFDSETFFGCEDNL